MAEDCVAGDPAMLFVSLGVSSCGILGPTSDKLDAARLLISGNSSIYHFCGFYF